LYRGDRISLWKSLDWWVVAIYVILCIIGCLSIYGASYDFENPGFFDFYQRSGRQFVWFILAVVIAFAILLMDSNLFFSWSFLLYFGMLGLLAVTIFIGSDIKGSNSWLVLGPFQVQPAEFSKFTTALVLARFMGSYNFNIKNPRNVLTIAFFTLSPLLLIFLQNETGSALVFASFLLVFYREGMPGFILFLVACLASFFVIGIKLGNVMLLDYTSIGQFAVLMLIIFIICGMLLIYKKDYRSSKIILIGNLSAIFIGIILNLLDWLDFNLCYLQLGFLIITVLYLFFNSLIYRASFYSLVALFAIISAFFLYSTDYAFDEILEPHQQIRISVLLGMKDDPSGASYNVNQSKIAIGSGGFFGKGFLNGTQTKLKYVPEQDTDFIFCTIGEEEGFLGSILVLGLYLILMVRLVYLAERQHSAFSRIYGYCVVSILLFHVMINIGMVIGLLPVIGIPLPFLSYGGSSLWAFTILLFIFLRLDADRTLKR
jgi:rod shape determining protein RodA